MSMELFLPAVCGSVAICMIVYSVQVIVYRLTLGQVGLCIGVYRVWVWLWDCGRVYVYPWFQ